MASIRIRQPIPAPSPVLEEGWGEGLSRAFTAASEERI